MPHSHRLELSQPNNGQLTQMFLHEHFQQQNKNYNVSLRLSTVVKCTLERTGDGFRDASNSRKR